MKSAALHVVMDAHVKKTLRAAGSISEAARRLKIARRTLQRWNDRGRTFLLKRDRRRGTK